MSANDKLEGARNAFVFFYAFQEAVGKEIGMQKAIDIAGKVDKEMGAMQGRKMKEQAGAEELDLKAVTALALSSINTGFGIASEMIDQSPEKMVIRCGRCPIYEAAELLGIDPGTTRQLCEAGPLKFMDGMVKQLNPKFTYQLRKFRISAGDFCEEQITPV